MLQIENNAIVKKNDLKVKQQILDSGPPIKE